MSHPNALVEPFLNISFENEGELSKDDVYSRWSKHGSALLENTALTFKNILKKKYPSHSIVSTTPYTFPFLSFPDLIARPLPDTEIDSVVTFFPIARRNGPGGVLLEQARFVGFTVAWKDYDFIVYIVSWPQGYFSLDEAYVLHESAENPALALISAIGVYGAELRDEVLVFDQGYWSKSSALWQEIQKANWDDVILKEEQKKAIRGDIERFFESEAVYKDLEVPWKRGLIFYGPAGNGKTISLKAAMKYAKVPLLYVRTFTSWMGDEAAMKQAFAGARQYAPCLLIIEDIDAHITDRNRSFFLNELDGLDNNDGILVIATTNHLDRVDGSLSNRPSRFDRKYFFDDPDDQERTLYIQYWQKKLASNKRASLPDRLLKEIVSNTKGFSFAYLKEIFVSTLLHLAANDDADFEKTLKEQIKTLRKQLDEKPEDFRRLASTTSTAQRRNPTEKELAEWRRERERTGVPVNRMEVTSTTMSVRRWVNGGFAA